MMQAVKEKTLVSVGEKFSRSVSLDGKSIAHFAELCEDRNPPHFDNDYAAKTRFGGIIACSPLATLD